MTKITGPQAEQVAERASGIGRKELDRQEEQKELGVPARTPKLRLLDTSRFGRIFHGRKARYVRPENVDIREALGWKTVKPEDAKKAGLAPVQGSQFVLMEAPIGLVEQHQRDVTTKNRRLEEAVRGQFKAAVAEGTRQLVDEGVLDSGKSLLSDERDGPDDNKD